MSRSINPMWLSLTAEGEAVSGFALGPIVSMSLHQLFLGGLVSTRAHLRFTGRFPCCTPRPELSTTTRQGVGNFQPELTFPSIETFWSAQLFFR